MKSGKKTWTLIQSEENILYH